MTPKTDAQNRALKEASKQKILETAIQLFAKHGYDGTSIRKIAQTAGISQGLLYNYFSSKEQLLIEIMQQGMTYAEQSFLAIPMDAAPLIQLEALVRQIFVELQKQQEFWRVFYSLRTLPTFHEILGTEIVQRTQMLRMTFQNFYDAAHQDEPEKRSYVLYAIVEGIIQQYLLFGAGYPLDMVVDDVVEKHIQQQYR